jgi:hypothetical protein
MTINKPQVTEKPPERPIHVRVAEALGWIDCHEVAYGAKAGAFVWWGQKTRGFPEGIPRYDTSWEATGPLVEKYEITLGFIKGWFAHCEGDSGRLYLNQEDREEPTIANGETPLLAVCALILALAEAGKLTEDPWTRSSPAPR